MYARNKHTKKTKEIKGWLKPSEVGYGKGFGESVLEFEDGTRCTMSQFKKHWEIYAQGSYDWTGFPPEIDRYMGFLASD